MAGIINSPDLSLYHPVFKPQNTLAKRYYHIPTSLFAKDNR